MYKFYYRNVIFILLSFVFCQNTHPYPPLSLITIPTSGVLPYATYSIEGLLIDNGGIVPRLSIGITKHLTLGFSWGIHNLIGDQRISFNKDYPEYHFKYRIWNEDLLKPAIVIGFDSQGRGQYRNILNVDTDEQFSRYEQKSFGYYIVASKNYVLMGNLGLHVGINKSLDNPKL